MRLCRYRSAGGPAAAFYLDDAILPFAAAAELTGRPIVAADDLLPCLPGGVKRTATTALQAAVNSLPADRVRSASLPIDNVSLLVPIPQPSKLLLLAGNYSRHVEERGGRATEREQTFPYVFMKPPLTTLTHPGDPIRIPAISPHEIDWELELGIVIGREARGVTEQDALNYVAGYTVVNDISDRAFHPHPSRTLRPKDEFFDWQHGKWHDTFCPLGPCILPADETPDPQALSMQLRVNGILEQDASTAHMIFPAAAVIAFISSFVTLSPGDIISTGTPHGVGKAKGKFLRPGDVVEAEIDGIGVLRNPVV